MGMMAGFLSFYRSWPRIAGALAILFGFVTAAVASDRPVNGILHGPERDFIQYACKSVAQLKMQCRFEQISIRKTATIDGLADRMAKAAKSAKQLTASFNTKTCKLAPLMGAVLAGKEPDEKLVADAQRLGILTNMDEFRKGLTEIREQSDVERRDNARTFDALAGICKTVGGNQLDRRAAFEQMARVEHDKAMRTCSVMANTYDQVFERSANGDWSHTSTFDGNQCGVVRISTFAKDGGYFWKYTTRKVVTNKSKALMPGFKCSDLDETAFEYRWQKYGSSYRGCDYVKWGL